MIGGTPLMNLNNIKKHYNLNADIVAKIEGSNPSGSVKDRAALNMLNVAMKDGIVNENTVIIEPTSGNTGIGLASIGASLGMRVILTMPETMSYERRLLLSAYGAEIVLTDGSLGMKGAIAKAEELAKTFEDSFIPSQFDNQANPNIHVLTTGPEIYQETDGKLDIFVSGIGTGGTVTGVGSYLKEQNANIQIVGVEPESSSVLSGGNPGPHKIQGIGAGFVPRVLDVDILDEIVKISDEEAIEMTRLIARTEGILVGISSGAAVAASVKIAQRESSEGKRIVAVLPDNGDRYLSTPVFKIKED